MQTAELSCHITIFLQFRAEHEEQFQEEANDT